MPRGKRDPWDGLRLPNAGSKLATPASLKIDVHYCHLRLWERWDYERFIRLAKLLNVTLEELASIACISHRVRDGLEQRNRLYTGGMPDRAAALVLTIFEAHVAKEFTEDIIANPFPDLNAVSADNDAPPGAT